MVLEWQGNEQSAGKKDILCAVSNLALAELCLTKMPVAESTIRALKHESSQSALAPEGRSAFLFRTPFQQ